VPSKNQRDKRRSERMNDRNIRPNVWPYLSWLLRLCIVSSSSSTAFVGSPAAAHCSAQQIIGRLRASHPNVLPEECCLRKTAVRNSHALRLTSLKAVLSIPEGKSPCGIGLCKHAEKTPDATPTIAIKPNPFIVEYSHYITLLHVFSD
jgi:hypothetical protein